MEDLSSVDWAPSKGSTYQGQGPKGNYFTTLKPSPPVSGRSTPSNVTATGLGQKPMSGSNTGSKSSTPVNDSFAGLVSFNSSQASRNLSLQEQQRVIQERKAKAEEERRRQFDSHFGGSQQTSSSTNFSKSSTPVGGIPPPAYSGTQQSDGVSLSKLINKPFAAIPNGNISSPSPENDEDLLAAFSSSAPVDKSSHMPPVQDSNHAQLNSVSDLEPLATTSGNGVVEDTLNDDDDPFGLGVQAPTHRPTSKPLVEQQDDDDVLGLLGRPVSEFPKPEPTEAKPSQTVPASSSDPLDRATAELVDMGFSAERSRQALETTESGSNVQAAVGWLLNQAHEDSRKEKQHHVSSRPSPSKDHSARRGSRRKSSGSESSRPAWMKAEGQPGPSGHRRDSRSPAKGEKDPAQLAQELGNNLFKTANSLWKTGTKKLNQAVAEFNAEGGTDQPKWMREANGETHGHKQKTGQHGEEELARRHHTSSGHSSRSGPPAAESKVTNEALLLESGDGRPQRKVPRRPATRPDSSDQIDLPERPREPRPQRPAIPQETSAKDPRRKLSRQAVEDEAAHAYVSPARRRKAVAKAAASSSSPPPPPPPAQPEPDLLFGSDQNAPPNVQPKQRPTSTASVRPLPSAKAPTITRTSTPKRSIPPISPSAVQQSTSSRKLGTEAFKRGDYAGATILYDRSLSALPPTHPLTLPVLTNRALSHLKTGDPKACIADAKTAIDLIGPSRGSNETIDLGSGEGNKPMADYWGKAMMRQAEALEQLERWTDAATSWKACVEAGVGGSASIAARNRCENAAKPKSAASVVKRPPPRPKPTPSAFNDLAPTSVQSAEAVTRLREANAAADKVDDEKFKLADQVDARILKWRAGKEGNLRALLSSLETVLWADAGWKKVGMGDVLLPGKVKVVYMKGIAKKMISAAVFATLNEAWERFKQENGL
ncbi:MAG: auxilin-like clathrin-binding protein required for normal clathrin function [Ramalina farinacea]|uniref:Auxilin-like clathrin-binding protein required for normal clathrin function n=1 Tax=Ramalina farinacea TaxID=258253 RepID=A0AA43QIT0_9LECA|nr:auxilin-like clathrin-binding protein required for normal clathrin function [Ramalina farinacea]